ncbi:hypothetical protein K492DRAFT_140487 [Lichtheimia hyalospora FSU 10163]|nr:hypothetical protein K492DRAFT_140487 [Lichtheimia hyalospora FSU 10163]
MASSAHLDAELLVILKKVSKRDATTKLKALEELETYLKENKSDISTIVPTWIRMYGKLTIEVDRRVRLAANNVHMLIATNAKKKLAPHLKEFIGAWILTLFDQSPDVAKCANASFEATFAEDKRQGVLEFCQKDIVNYVAEIVLYKTPDTLSDPRHVSKEDMASKFARVIAGCFYTLCHLMDKLPLDKREECLEDYENLFDNETLWKFASHESPIIRKALYRFVKTTILKWKDIISPRLTVISPALFTSFLKEKEAATFSELWDAILLLTKDYPESWNLAGTKKPILPKFYNFLRNGLNGSVHIGYPSILVLIANFPDEIKNTKNFYKDFFENFWTGLSSGSIDKSNSVVFVNAYVECIIYVLASLSNATDSQQHSDDIVHLTENAFTNAIKAYLTKGASANLGDKIAPVLANQLVTMANIQNLQKYTAGFWSNLEHWLIQTVVDGTSPGVRSMNIEAFCRNTSILLIEINVKLNNLEPEKRQSFGTKAVDWAKRLVQAAIGSSLVFKDKAGAFLDLANKLIVEYWNQFKDNEFEHKIVDQSKLIVSLFSESQESTLSPLCCFFINVIARLDNVTSAQELWLSVLDKLVTMETGHRQVKILMSFFQQIATTPSTISYHTEMLDTIFTKYAIDELQQETPAMDRSELEHLVTLGLNVHLSNQILTEQALDRIITSYQDNLAKLNHCSATANDNISSKTLLCVLSILNIINNLKTENVRDLMKIPAAKHIPTEVFEAMFTKPTTDIEGMEEDIERISKVASTVWEIIVAGYAAHRTTLSTPILARIKTNITDVNHSASPSEMVKHMQRLTSTLYVANSENEQAAITDIVGDLTHWKTLRAPFNQYTTSFLTVGILDNYAALVNSPLVEDDEITPVRYDMYGLSSYARMIVFIAEYILETGVSAFFNDNNGNRDWILYQLMLASVECQWGLAVPGSCRVWDNSVGASSMGIQAFIQHTESILNHRLDTLIATSGVGSDWNVKLYDHVVKKTSSNDPLILFIGYIMRSDYISADGALDEEITPGHAAAARILETFMKRLTLSLGSSNGIQSWLDTLKAESTHFHLPTKVALYASLKNAFAESMQYKNLQSDLTSKLSGVSSLEQFNQDETKAWTLIVLLNASSLKFGAFAIPSQRLMHLLLTVRKWFDDDSILSDFDPHHRTRITMQLAQLFANLAESTQDVSGGQWQFFLERSYEWIAYSDPNVDEELPVIYQALILLKTMQRLSQEGIEDLEIAFAEQRQSIDKMLLDLFAREKDVQLPITKPRLLFQTLVADLLEHIPDVVLHEASCISELFTLLFSNNETVQKRAFELLKKFTASLVQDLSVSLELSSTNDEDDSSKAPIAPVLLHSILEPPNIARWHSAPFDDQPLHQVSGYLLSWLVMFEHFINITFRLKQEYTSQLKEKDAVAALLPFLSTLLGVGVGQDIHAFDLMPWNIEDYDMDGFDSTMEMSYQLLAAHLYYRALKYIPSLVRQWWVDCKNRQLTIGVESYVEKNYSGALINSEVNLINEPDTKSMLEDNDDNEFTVKALKAANEVSATYRVDEQNMQIVIRLPSNYPLRQIDVESVQKVGVSDKQWRGWMFSVAAVIGSQNGNIVDALTVFKRNLNLHFSGVEDCTICYSIISAQDRSIPTKQCRTCKNKFHASCLYKWFRSSNSASCPLCRTVF